MDYKWDAGISGISLLTSGIDLKLESRCFCFSYIVSMRRSWRIRMLVIERYKGGMC